MQQDVIYGQQYDAWRVMMYDPKRAQLGLDHDFTLSVYTWLYMSYKSISRLMNIQWYPGYLS